MLAWPEIITTTAAGSRDLLLAHFAADFRLRRRAGEKDLSDLHTEIIAQPADWLQADLYQSFSPRTRRLRELNTGVTLREGDRWSLRWGNNFLRRELEDYSVDGRARLREGLEFITRLQYDARRRRFNEQTYGLAFAVANTWLVTSSVSVYSGRKRESSFGFDLRVDALGDEPADALLAERGGEDHVGRRRVEGGGVGQEGFRRGDLGLGVHGVLY